VQRSGWQAAFSARARPGKETGPVMAGLDTCLARHSEETARLGTRRLHRVRVFRTFALHLEQPEAARGFGDRKLQFVGILAIQAAAQAVHAARIGQSGIGCGIQMSVVRTTRASYRESGAHGGHVQKQDGPHGNQSDARFVRIEHSVFSAVRGFVPVRH
jgi:hypothetical protein